MSKQYLTHTTHEATHPSDVFSLAIHTPSSTLVSASGSSSLQVHSTYAPPYHVDLDTTSAQSAAAFRHLQTLSGAHKLGCHHVVASREGNRAASIGFGSELRIWRYETSTNGHANSSNSQAQTDQITGGWTLEGTITSEKKAGDAWAIALSPDGRYLASTSVAGHVNVWDLDASPSDHTNSSTQSQDQQQPADAQTSKPKRSRSPKKSNNNTDQPIGTKLRDYDTGKGFGMCIDISPSGSLTVTGHVKGSLHLYDNASARLSASLLSLAGAVRTVRFSPAETLLAAAGDGQYIALFSVKSGEQIAILEGHQSWVFDLDWNGTGELIVSGGWGGEARVWSMDRRECVAVVRGDEGNQETGAGAAVWGVRWLKMGKGEGFVTAGRRGDLTFFREAAAG